MKNSGYVSLKQLADEKRKSCLIPFTEEEWYLWELSSEEEYVVPLIKKYLRTPEQRATMNELDISIEDMLNGRVEGEAAQAFVAETFTAWNAKIGYKQFGY